MPGASFDHPTTAMVQIANRIRQTDHLDALVWGEDPAEDEHLMDLWVERQGLITQLTVMIAQRANGIARIRSRYWRHLGMQQHDQ